MGISATTGLISGLDYESIIEATMEVERQPIEVLQVKQSDYLAQITSYGSIKSALSTLQDAIEDLKEPSEFISYSATSSDSDIITVETDDDAGTGTYTLTVEQLAKTEIVNTYDGFSSTDEEIGTGVLSISTGEDELLDIVIDSDNNTLKGIADAINESGAGVSATIIKLNDGAYALSLTADETGRSINFSIEDDDGTNNDENGLSRLYTDPANETVEVTQAAEKALFTFNGLSIERESNEVDDLIDGVTINLVGTDSDDSDGSVTIQVKKKYTSMTTAIEAFVSAYNNMVSVFESEQYFDTDSGDAGTLFGDYSANMIKNGIVNMLKLSVDGVDDSVNSLSALCIELTEEGTLEFDSDIFQDAVEDNEEDVISFFTNDEDENEGFSVSLYDYLDSYTKSDGIIDQKTDNYQEMVDDIDDDIERKELLLEAREERLWDYYNNLELKLSELQALQSSVETMISTLSSYDS